MVGAKVRVCTRVHLGLLLPEDVAVELYLGRLSSAGDFINAGSTQMEPVEKVDEGCFSFQAVTICPESGMHGFTVRIRPHHPDLSVPFQSHCVTQEGHAQSGSQGRS
jgi:glycogen phosphorylase